MKRLLLAFALLVAGVAAGDTPVSTTECSDTSPSQSACTATENVQCACAVASASTPASSLLTGLVHYWTLDEASGTRADSVGAATLTDNNTVGSTAGKNASAGLFVAANSESLSNGTINPGDTDYAFSLWIKPTTLSIYTLVARDGPTARTFLLDIEANKVKFYRLPTDSVTSTVTLTTGTWFHVYAYHDSVNNLIGISVNNETIVTAATTGASNGTAGENFRVGARDTGGSPLYFDGAIDELGMWSRTLTVAERTTLYNSGAGKFYPSF